MNFHEPYRRVAESLRRNIDNDLTSLGLLCRVFGRAKAAASLRRKLSASPGKYAVGGRLVQDLVGIRVVLYFPEDLQIVEEILRSSYECDDASCTIDTPVANVFSVTRHNLIFRLPSEFDRDVQHLGALPVDRTFEVQIRTILSEGWHEVEHDLRYKRLAHWADHDDLSRGLNGVVATLETAEWSMRKIFDDLAARHLAAKQWAAMLHTVLRMRVSSELSPAIESLLSADERLAADLYRINRMSVFRSLSKLAPRIPLSLDNMVHLWNFTELHNLQLSSITPQVLSDTFSASLSNPRTSSSTGGY